MSMLKLLRSRLVLSLLGLLAIAGSTGCASKLETGYEPRQLGVSSAERKGYYASPYSAEAAAAGRAQQTDDFRSMRRPGGPSRQY
jgi:hypothetical protein